MKNTRYTAPTAKEVKLRTLFNNYSVRNYTAGDTTTLGDDEEVVEE